MSPLFPREDFAGRVAKTRAAMAAAGADHASYGFTAATRERFAALLPKACFIDLPYARDMQRAVKSPAEIALIAQAAGIADKATAAIASVRAIKGARSGWLCRAPRSERTYPQCRNTC